jgi:hypothetical protein
VNHLGQINYLGRSQQVVTEASAPSDAAERRAALQVVPASPNVPEDAGTQGSQVSGKAAAEATTTTAAASPQAAAPPSSVVRLPPTPALVLPAAYSRRTAAAVEELSPGTPITPVTVRRFAFAFPSLARFRPRRRASFAATLCAAVGGLVRHTALAGV